MFASTSLALVLATAPVRAGAEAVPRAAIAEAIVRAVHLRLGDAATVVVSSLSGVRLVPGSLVSAPASVTTFVATPEPAAHLGEPVRFLLSDAPAGRQARRVGEAIATLQVSAPLVQTTRAVARGERLAEADVAVRTVPIGRTPLRRLLSIDDARGARATRDISAGTMLTRADIAPEPMVRAGDVVRAHARVSGLEITADMVAAESGNAGEVVRVVNRETKYAVRARVLARGEVEVVNVR